MFSTQVWMCIYSCVNFIYYREFGQIHTHRKPAWFLWSFSRFPHRFTLWGCKEGGCSCNSGICWVAGNRPEKEFGGGGRKQFKNSMKVAKWRQVGNRSCVFISLKYNNVFWLKILWIKHSRLINSLTGIRLIWIRSLQHYMWDNEASHHPKSMRSSTSKKMVQKGTHIHKALNGFGVTYILHMGQKLTHTKIATGLQMYTDKAWTS